MIAAKNSPEQLNVEIGDIAVLRRKWRAALKPGQLLPPYEDVMLGSLGRLSDHVMLLRGAPDRLEISHGGRYVQHWLGVEAWNVPFDSLPPDCTTILVEATTSAAQGLQPYLAVAHLVRDGIVQVYDVLILPTASRWGGMLFGVYVNERGQRYNLLDAIFANTDEGVLSLAIIRDAASRPSDLQIVHLNNSASRHLRAPADWLLWRRIRECENLLGMPAVFGWMLDAANSEVGTQFEFENEGRSLRLSATVFGDMVSLTISDVTAIKRREDSFRLLFENNPMPMWLFDADTTEFLAVNDAAVHHYGYDRETFQRMCLREIWPRDEWELHSQALKEIGDTYHSTQTWRHLKADGSEIQVLTFGRRIAFKGRDSYLVAIVDITQRRKAEARVAHMAHHDGLTDLPNRVLYQERLAQALELAQSSGRQIAVLYIDLDLFKNVNDSFGHPVGDRLLVFVADRLRKAIHEADSVARLGGDEFAIIMSGDTSPRTASDYAVKLIEVVSKPYDIDGIEAVIGASIGIAISPGDGDSSEHLMRNADMALYRAKSEGGGVHRFFEKEMDQQAQTRREMELDLRRAFSCGEFELHYQPLVDIAVNRVSGFEALMRWRHPRKGMVSPADFIPVAEDIGLIVGLGEWAMREACKEAATWPPDIKVAVNLSPVQFRNRNLVQIVISALAASGLPPRRLELEITESVFLAETEANLATLHQLRELGVSISMDDFGTGYSSLSYLRSFPFDKIKIDRSFVKDVADRPDCEAIVRAISGLGRSLQIRTTAEGVETEDQLAWLRAEGCNEVQGFLFGHARPPAEIGALLKRFNLAADAA